TFFAYDREQEFCVLCVLRGCLPFASPAEAADAAGSHEGTKTRKQTRVSLDDRSSCSSCHRGRNYGVRRRCPIAPRSTSARDMRILLCRTSCQSRWKSS